jgi:hypothetical protein
MALTSDEVIGLQEKIKHASSKERETHWKGVPFNEAMSKWETLTDIMLAPYKTDPAKRGELLFLQKILSESSLQPLDQVEVSARALYNTFITGEGRGDVEFFVRRITERVCKQERERYHELIKKLALIYGKESAKTALQRIDDAETYSVIGTDLKTGQNIHLTTKARLQTLYLIGTSGTGKSTLDANLVVSDTKNGLGVAVLDYHGDLIKTIIASLPENRVKDVIYLNIEDVDHPYGLNLYECQRLTIRDMAKTASFVSHAFERIWGAGTDTPRLMQNLRAVTRTLIENPGTTFAEIPLLYSNATVRNKMVANLSNPSIISYWEDYERKSQRDRDLYIESTMNKVNAFLDEPMIRNIFAQSKTSLNFREIMDSKILLVRLSPQYEEASRLIGAVIIGKILLAAFSRIDTPEENRRQFNLYCDEFQRFATSDFAILISEARKFRIATTLSHQTLAQLDEANKAAAIAAGNLIVFRVSGEDAKDLACNFDTTPTKEIIGEEPIRAPIADVISHLVKRGHNDQRVTRFATSYLQNFEDLISKITHYNSWPVYGEWPIDLHVYSRDILTARELLNACLYRCMVEKTADFSIPPLAIYILSVAKNDGSEAVFFPYINYTGMLPPNYFKGFFKGKKRVEVFGEPNFLNRDSVSDFLASYRRKKQPSAASLLNLITELRYTMAILAEQPILVDTGQYQPKYQNRPFSDMENQIARDLTNQPNFQAKVKLLSGEHVIQTKKSPQGLTGSQLEERIAQIQAQTRQNYCKPRREVEREIRERQERLKTVENRPNPTSAKATQPQRTRRRTAEETPPAWK